MLACRAAGGADPAIRRAGREAAAAAKARAEVVALAQDLAEQFTRGAWLKGDACEAIFAKAWAGHQNGQDVHQAAIKAARGWRRRQDIKNQKRNELVALAKSIAARAARVAGEKYDPMCTIADEQLAYRAAYKTARSILTDGKTEHRAYIAARRTAKAVHTS